MKCSIDVGSFIQVVFTEQTRLLKFCCTSGPWGEIEPLQMCPLHLRPGTSDSQGRGGMPPWLKQSPRSYQCLRTTDLDKCFPDFDVHTSLGFVKIPTREG